MMHPKKCPVCEGTGGWPNAITLEKKPCHGCDGKGWVAVEESVWLNYDPTGHITHADADGYPASFQCVNCGEWRHINAKRGTPIDDAFRDLICNRCGCSMGRRERRKDE